MCANMKKKYIDGVMKEFVEFGEVNFYAPAPIH